MTQLDEVEAVRLSPLVPTDLRFGSGCFSDAARLARRLGKHALVVTSRTAMERLGYTEQLTSDLRRQGIASTCFNRVRLSPTTDDVDRGAALARRVGADLVIGLGGGSPIDCAKAIAAVAPGIRPAVDYLYGRAEVTAEALPIMAIPTTAGTGSEMNKAAIVTDPQRHFKDGIRSRHLFPRVAIVDPELMHSLPRDVTAQTGFDAMTHAVESYVSPKARPETDALALGAIKRVSEFLPVAIEEPHNAAARNKLAWASTTMGINLATVGSCFPHRADKALCALHPEIPHGQSVALFYPYWLKSCYSGNVERFAVVAETIRPRAASLSAGSRAAAVMEIVAEFIRRIGLGKRMADFGVIADEIPMLCERVVGDLSVNPIPIEREDLPAILSGVLAGT